MTGIAGGMMLANYRPTVSSGDPYWNDVGLLLHMDGADNGTTFTDSSLSASVWTATGGSRTDTGQKKFGTASYEMQSISTDSPQTRGIITANSSAYPDIKMRNNFTYEFWYYTSNTTSIKGISGYGFFSCIVYVNGLTLTMEASSVTAGLTSVQRTLNLGTLTASSWNHVAITREGATVQAWINGTRTLNITDFFTNEIRTYRTATAGNVMAFGSTNHTGTTTQHLGGWLDEVRLTQDIIRYSGSTITVPTAAFPEST